MTVERKAPELGEGYRPVDFGTPEEDRVEKSGDGTLLVAHGREEEGVGVPLHDVGYEEQELERDGRGEQVRWVGEELSGRQRRERVSEGSEEARGVRGALSPLAWEERGRANQDTLMGRGTDEVRDGSRSQLLTSRRCLTATSTRTVWSPVSLTTKSDAAVRRAVMSLERFWAGTRALETVSLAAFWILLLRKKRISSGPAS